MKQRILVTCITLLILGGCKARKVLITHTDSTTVSHVAINKDSVVVKKDTTSSHITQVVIKSDSGNTTTTITPVTGGTLIVDSGKISGIGKIVKVHHYVKHKQANTVTTNQARNNDSTNVASTKVKNDSTHVVASKKTVVSTPNNMLVIYIAIGIGVLLLIIFILWKVFKPKVL